MQIVLGAGLGGLSLAVALVRAGVSEPIVLVDRRTAFGRDRTWCTWDVGGTPFLELARHRWSDWEIRTNGSVARASSAAHPYVHLDSQDFYEAALGVLDAAPNVELRLGEGVLEVGDGWAVTERGRLDGTVHDALALGSPALRGRGAELWQAFLGWEVRTDRPVFDPGRVTLMDFRDGTDGMVEFVYVLPYAPDAGLVEHTTFAPEGPDEPARRAALEAYLGERLGAREWTIDHEERGRIPMTSAPPAAVRGGRTTAVGTAGGAVRGSSGYAFARTQAHVTAVARSIAAGEPPPERVGAARHALLDTVFLRALQDDPGAFADWSRRLVDRLPADVFARFMSDASTPADELRVIAALPKAPFLRAAAAAARHAKAGR